MVRVTVPGWPRAALPLVAPLLLAALSGCGSPTPVRPDRFYRLEPPVLTAPSGTPAPATLLVTDLSAPGLLNGRQILFRTRAEPLVTQRYEDLLWEEAPAGALAGALADALRTAGVFRFVVVPAERARADLLLGGRLTRFEHLPTAEPPRVAAALTLVLTRADDRRVLMTRTYAGEEPLAASTPEAMVEAFARLGARLIALAVRDLQSARDRLTITGQPPSNRPGPPGPPGPHSAKSKSIASPAGAT